MSAHGSLGAGGRQVPAGSRPWFSGGQPRCFPGLWAQEAQCPSWRRTSLPPRLRPGWASGSGCRPSPRGAGGWGTGSLLGPVTGGGRSGLEVLVDGSHVEHHTLPVRPLGPHHLADVLAGSKQPLEPGRPPGLRAPPRLSHRPEGRVWPHPRRVPRAAQGLMGLIPTRARPPGLPHSPQP